MKYKTVFLLVLVLACILNVQAQVYQDGSMLMEKIGKVEGKSILMMEPAPAEIGGVIIQVRELNSGDKRFFYHFNADSVKGVDMNLLCSDNNKEFIDRGENLNGGMMASKDGLFVTTMDKKNVGQPLSAWKCGYDAKVNRITGLNDVIHLSTTSAGKKDAKAFVLRLPFPSNEDGKYYVLGWYFEYPSGKVMEPIMFKFDPLTQEGVEVLTIPLPNYPASGDNGAGFWTDGNTIVSHAGLSTNPNLYQIIRCSPPRFCSSLLLYGGLNNGEQVGNVATYDIIWDGALDTSYTSGSLVRLLHCNITCITYLKSEDVSSIGALMPTPNTVPYADPCTTVSVGSGVLDATAVLVCKGEALRPFIHGGVFPGETVSSRYYYANTEDRKGTYIFQACPGQELWYETCWIVWKASIAPVIVTSPNHVRFRRR